VFTIVYMETLRSSLKNSIPVDQHNTKLNCVVINSAGDFHLDAGDAREFTTRHINHFIQSPKSLAWNNLDNYQVWFNPNPHKPLLLKPNAYLNFRYTYGKLVITKYDPHNHDKFESFDLQDLLSSRLVENIFFVHR